MKRVLFLFVFFMAAIADAQDLTGVWQGHFRSGNMASRSSLFDDRYKFEVQLAQHDKLLEAVTYSYLSSLFYGKASAKGTVNPKTSKVLLQEGKLLEVRNQAGDVCIMTCFLQYSKSGDEEFLEGTFVSMNTRDSSNCGRGTVFLRKVSSSDFYKEPFVEKREEALKKSATPGIVSPTPLNHPMVKGTPSKKTGNDSAIAKVTVKPAAPAPAKKGPVKSPAPTPSPAPTARISTPQTVQPMARMDSTGGIGQHFAVAPPGVLVSRSNPLVKSIIVNTNEVTLNIYDDGAIDHDTISVYLDKKLVIAHAMLTDRPIVLTLHLDETMDFHELIMVADNEGEIPPNTSLMIVKAGDKEYEVRITSTEQKNAVVTFKYEKLK